MADTGSVQHSYSEDFHALEDSITSPARASGQGAGASTPALGSTLHEALPAMAEISPEKDTSDHPELSEVASDNQLAVSRGDIVPATKSEDIVTPADNTEGTVVPCNSTKPLSQPAGAAESQAMADERNLREAVVSPGTGLAAQTDSEPITTVGAVVVGGDIGMTTDEGSLSPNASTSRHPIGEAVPQTGTDQDRTCQGAPQEVPVPELASSPKSKSLAALGSYNDLRSKTAFSSVTTDGVNKNPPSMRNFSNFRTGPKFSLGTKLPSSFIRSSSTPAPGAYSLPGDDNSAKYRTEPRFSFGGCARFGLAQSPAKQMPGPGTYNPKDPTLSMTPKVGFGSGARAKVALTSQHNPGPGAYEARSSLGNGRMFTAGGRHPVNHTRSRSQPGPGAYTPSMRSVKEASPMCGFGTSLRGGVAGARAGQAPGPGSYEMQSFRGTGSDAPKYSTSSRHRLIDLNSYVTPGPGSYNAHITSFA